MYSLATIRDLNEKAARDARRQGKHPLRMDKVEDFGREPIPHLGYACKSLDRKHRRVETLFVDTSGFGSDNEPALSLRQFKGMVGTPDLEARSDPARAGGGGAVSGLRGCVGRVVTFRA